MRWALRASTASAGRPKRVLDRVLTSQTTRRRESVHTMSSSPNLQRQLRSSTTSPCSVRYAAARSSPRLPRASFAAMPPRWRARRSPAPRSHDLWTAERDGDNSGTELVALRQPQIGLVQLLDVDVLKRDHPHVLDEPGGPVHVPYPRVGHADFEVDLAVRVARRDVDRVGEVEAALRLHDVGELGHDVPVLLVERELHLGLVLLEILGAHGSNPPSPASDGPTGSSSLWTRAFGSPNREAHAPRTFTNEYRCTGLGPCSSSAASWIGVQ